jgi:hypothetical protein
MQDEGKEETAVHTKLSKKPYQKPELQVYGDLREITQTFATKGKMDHGPGRRDQTRP